MRRRRRRNRQSATFSVVLPLQLFFVLFYHKPHIIRYVIIIIIIKCSATNRSPLKLVIHRSLFPLHLLILISYRHPYRRGHFAAALNASTFAAAALFQGRLLYTHCTHNSAPQQWTEKLLNYCCQSVLK